MIRTSLRLLLLILAASAELCAAETHQVKIGEPLPNAFEGWGLSPCMSGADKENLEQFPRAIELLAKLRPDIWKLYIGAGATDPLTNDQGRADFLDRTVLPQLVLREKLGVENVVLVFEAPPRSYRQSFSDDGIVDAHANGLLESAEAEYARAVAAAVRYLNAKSRITMLVVQNSPNIPLQYGACYMPAEQWRRLVQMTRAELDKAGLNHVALLGPDTIGYAPAKDYTDFRGSPVAVHRVTVHPSATDLGTPRPGKSSQGRSGPENAIWVTGWNPVGARSEIAGLQQTVRRIAEDVGTRGVRAWFWEKAYLNERSARCFIFGEGDKTLLYRFFQLLLTNVRPGSRVLECRLDTAALSGFAFENGTRTVLVLANAGSEAVNVKVSSARALSWSHINILAEADGDWAETTSESSNLNLPPQSVVLATAGAAP